MKKNPGRSERRSLHKKAATKRSDKLQAVNERRMLWRSRLAHGKPVTAEQRAAIGA